MSRLLNPSAADLLMYELERQAGHPDANSTTGVVVHLRGAVPDLAGLRDHVTARLAGLPCLTHVLTGDGPQARWTPAAPDMTRQIRAQQVDSGPEALEAAVRLLLRTPWPEGVPTWRMILLHGHEPDGFALLYLTHHAIQDAANIGAVFETLFGQRSEQGQFSVLSRDIPSNARPPLRQTLSSAVTLLRHARKHHLWQWPAHPLSDRRELTWIQVPSASLRTAARVSGVSTNDVHLAALAHAITQWAKSAWPRAVGRALPLLVPVNLRTADEVAAPGNRLFLTPIDLPGGSMPVSRRLAHTRAVTTALKSAGHKSVLRAALTRLPWWLFRRLMAASTVPGRLTVCASHLVGRRHLHYGEAAVHRIDPIIICPPGVPMAVATMTYGDTTSACFRVDRALPHADSLPLLWRQALTDLADTSP
ncbi:hypothetical protein GCM10010304_82220 [Streptomyces roseoviolaceus]